MPLHINYVNSILIFLSFSIFFPCPFHSLYVIQPEKFAYKITFFIYFTLNATAILQKPFHLILPAFPVNFSQVNFNCLIIIAFFHKLPERQQFASLLPVKNVCATFDATVVCNLIMRAFYCTTMYF